MDRKTEDSEFVEQASSPTAEAWEMFKRNHAAMTGLVILLVIAIGSIFGPFVYPTDPFDMVWAPFSPPGEEGYLFGTDYLGRDLLAMVIHGARVFIDHWIVGSDCVDLHRRYCWCSGWFLQRLY